MKQPLSELIRSTNNDYANIGSRTPGIALLTNTPYNGTSLKDHSSEGHSGMPIEQPLCSHIRWQSGMLASIARLC